MSHQIPTPVCPFSGQLATRVCQFPGCDKVPFICKSCANDECLDAHIHGESMDTRNWEAISIAIAKAMERPREGYSDDLAQADRSWKLLQDTIEELRDGFTRKMKQIKDRERSDNTRLELFNNLNTKNYGPITGESIRRLITNKPLDSEQKQQQELNREVKEACREYTTLIDRLIQTVKDFKRQTETMKRSSQLRQQAEKNIRDGRDEIALKCFTEAVDLCPNDEKNWQCRANLFFKMKRLDEALRDAEKVLEYNPINHFGHYLKGKICLEKRQYATALKELSDAIEYMDSKPQYYEKRGNCYFASSRYEKALADYSTVLKLRQSPFDYLNEGAAYSMLGLKELGEAKVEAGLKKLDEHPDAAKQQPFQAYAFNHLEDKRINRNNDFGLFGCSSSFKI